MTEIPESVATRVLRQLEYLRAAVAEAVGYTLTGNPDHDDAQLVDLLHVITVTEKERPIYRRLAERLEDHAMALHDTGGGNHGHLIDLLQAADFMRRRVGDGDRTERDGSEGSERTGHVP